MQCTAWPVALFATMYVNSHLKESASPITPDYFIPGMKPIEVQEVPFDVIEANFRAYQDAYERGLIQE